MNLLTIAFRYSLKRVIVIAVILVFSISVTFAQEEINVTGKIIDGENSSALSGVSILVKGAGSGTTTNAEGVFHIKAPKTGILVFSLVGYTGYEFPIKGKSEISINLFHNAGQLSDVVVVGYGKQKRVDLTGAVGTIQSDYIKDRPITNATQALSGGVSGVFVNQNSGVPGSDAASIKIRGIGTLNNTNPLILVDGIESGLDNLDPNDIESISVLKDASSASIYGSRGANGVILVTTKRGKLNTPPSVSYSGYYGTTAPTHMPSLITNSVQFMQLLNEAADNSGLPSLKFTDAQIDQYKQIGPNTDWLKEGIHNGPIYQNNVSVTGGGENTSYLLSLGNISQDAITPNTNYTRYNVRLNLDSKVSDKFKIGTALALMRGNQNSFGSDIVGTGGDAGILSKMIQASPLFPAYDSKGRLAEIDQNLNYLWGAAGNPFAPSTFNTYDRVNNQFLGSVFADYEIVSGLKIRGMMGLNYNSINSSSFFEQGDVYDWVSGLAIPPPVNLGRSRFVSNSYSNDNTGLLQLNYDKKIKAHQFGVLLGYTQEDFSYNYFDAGRTTFPTNDVRVLNAGNPLTASNSENATQWALRSYFGRLTYNFDQKYLFEFNIRRDGSSRFGTNNLYGTFPSVSAGWIISKESFFKNVKNVDLLKIRASWGQLGNQYTQGGDYPSYAQVSVNANYVFNNDVVPGAAQITFDNPNIKWETTTSSDIGLDLNMFKKLNIVADYFERTAADILYPLPVPATAGGFAAPVINTGKVQNKGWEFSANYADILFGDVRFTIGFNITHVTSKLVYINPNVSADQDKIVNGNFILQRGAPINAIYGLKVKGIFQDSSQITKSPVQFGNYGPGDLQFEDIDHNDTIDSRDKVVLGHEDPNWYYGATLSFDYKGFDLSAIFQGVADFQGYSNSEFYYPFFDYANLGSQWLNRWTPQNHSTTTPRLFVGTGPNVDITNSYWVQDRSFFRLKNLQFGYSFNNKLLSKIHIQKLHLYINGQNLFTVTKFQGFDPERPETGGRGADGYPVLKIYTAGLNVTF